MTPQIDVLVILHNSRTLIPGLLHSLRRISIPVNVYFLDNNSTDGSADILAESLPGLPFRAHLLRSLNNNGFAGGMNRLAGQSQAEFMFVLNPTSVSCDRNGPVRNRIFKAATR